MGTKLNASGDIEMSFSNVFQILFLLGITSDSTLIITDKIHLMKMSNVITVRFVFV